MNKSKLIWFAAGLAAGVYVLPRIGIKLPGA